MERWWTIVFFWHLPYFDSFLGEHLLKAKFQKWVIQSTPKLGLKWALIIGVGPLQDWMEGSFWGAGQAPSDIATPRFLNIATDGSPWEYLEVGMANQSSTNGAIFHRHVYWQSSAARWTLAWMWMWAARCVNLGSAWSNGDITSGIILVRQQR